MLLKTSGIWKWIWEGEYFICTSATIGDVQEQKERCHHQPNLLMSFFWASRHSKIHSLQKRCPLRQQRGSMTGCKQMQQKSNGLMESFPSRSFCVPYPNFFLSSYVKNARSLLFFECRCGILPYSSCCPLTIPVTKPCSPALSTNHKSSADSEDQGSVSRNPNTQTYMKEQMSKIILSRQQVH